MTNTYNIYKCYDREMQNWISYLDIEEKYTNEKQRNCLLFIFLWLRYNEYYNSKFKGGKDLTKATKIADDECLVNKYETLKHSYIDNFKNIKINNQPRTYIVNICNSDKIYYTEDKCTLKDYLTLIYKIRCNIFHGDKPPNKENIEIINWAYITFNELISDVLNEYIDDNLNVEK